MQLLGTADMKNDSQQRTASCLNPKKRQHKIHAPPIQKKEAGKQREECGDEYERPIESNDGKHAAQ